MEAAAASAVRGLRAGCQRLRYGAGYERKWNLQTKQTSLRFYSTGMTLDNINKPDIDRIIRVDHAGEYGANRIYAGQMAVLGRTTVGPVIQQMWNQEKDHLKKFNELMVTFRVRPTILLPFWNVAGFALGAGTALLGKEGAMACTVAVEESISEHYNNQMRTLMEEDPEKYKELLQLFHSEGHVNPLELLGCADGCPHGTICRIGVLLYNKEIRDDELEHHDIGLDHDAELAPAYSLLKTAIQIGCKAAIFLSERI